MPRSPSYTALGVLVLFFLTASPGVAATTDLTTIDLRFGGGSWAPKGQTEGGYSSGTAELALEFKHSSHPAFLGFGMQSIASERMVVSDGSDVFSGGNVMARFGYRAERFSCWTGFSLGSYTHTVENTHELTAARVNDEFQQKGLLLGTSYDILRGHSGNIRLFAEAHNKSLQYRRAAIPTSLSTPQEDRSYLSVNYGIVLALHLNNSARSQRRASHRTTSNTFVIVTDSVISKLIKASPMIGMEISKGVMKAIVKMR